MNITVWSNFSKRINSTKQPAANTGTIKTVLLKDVTDIEAPVFELNTLDFSINYVQAFGHYYFCDVRNLDGNRSELVCTMDHLATFKDNIKAYSGLVQYTSASSRLDITDPRNMPASDIEIKQASVSAGFPLADPANSDGIYIIGVIGKKGTLAPASGTVQYWGVSGVELLKFFNDVFGAGTILENIKATFNNLMDSIVSCIWLPFSGFGSGGGFGSLTNIVIGSEPLTAQGYPLERRTSIHQSGVTLNPIFPMESAHGKSYLDKSPYTTGILFLPFVGNVPLDVDALYTGREIHIIASIDMATGDLVYDVQYADALATYKTETYTGNCATKVPVAGASYDGVGVAAGILTSIGGVAAGIASVATGGALAAGAAAAAVGGAAGAAKSLELHSMLGGSASSALGFRLGGDIVATLFTKVPAETNLTAYKTAHGMPYFKVATLSSLSGYIQCADASVEIPGTAAEKTAVNGYLNSGFYLE